VRFFRAERGKTAHKRIEAKSAALRRQTTQLRFSYNSLPGGKRRREGSR